MKTFLAAAVILKFVKHKMLPPKGDFNQSSSYSDAFYVHFWLLSFLDQASEKRMKEKKQNQAKSW